ncbi:MAG TPA: cyclopropane-fatty-acyl-phospholipid synthase family protein [Solirubrobacterales bacterium]
MSDSAVSGNAYRGASAAAIQGHYDVGNEFYALWLDPSRTYSCALWGEGDDLEAAQMRKLDYLAAGARAEGARRVLDVGCGWGSMMRRLLDRHGVERTVGLTLSEAQAEQVAAELGERCEVRLENWSDHEPEQPYDAIVSIGAFEHFADFGIGAEERIASYREFFSRCRAWLPPGGRLALQTIVKGANVRLDRRMTRELLFVIDRIFPESELPWPAEMIEASTRELELISLCNDAEHYRRTCAAWLAQLEAKREAAEALAGADVVEDYARYLQASVDAFERRHVGLVRVVFEKV